MSSTKNVKLGVCKVVYDGQDLGYTKGGVEVDVSTDTHKVTVDQFGQSEINEYIQKRSVMAKLPLAETTLENLVKIMPGATLIDNATKQVATLTVDTASDSIAYTFTIDGVAYTITSDASATQGEIAIALVAAVNADASASFSAATTAIATDVVASDVVLTAKISGESYVVASSDVNMTLVQTTAAVAGAKRVDVTNGIGSNLLSSAKVLSLRPIGSVDSNDDFTIPLAATAGGLSFAYKFDEERIYNVEFMGYPDAVTKLLFTIGDTTAV